MIGDGEAGGEGIRAEAVRSGAPRHADATVTLRNSILRDFATPIWRHGESALIGINAGVARVLISHSAYDSSIAPIQSGPGAFTAADNLGPVDPRFAGPGDFHLLDGSALIDAGQSDGLSETDLDGAGARPVRQRGRHRRPGHRRALPAGRSRAVLSAIDPTGNSSAAHRLAFRIADDRPRPPR